jgi:hypothetical protein
MNQYHSVLSYLYTYLFNKLNLQVIFVSNLL